MAAQKTAECPLEGAVEITSLLSWEHDRHLMFSDPRTRASVEAIPAYSGLLWADRPCVIKNHYGAGVEFTADAVFIKTKVARYQTGDIHTKFVTHGARVFCIRATEPNRCPVYPRVGDVVPAGTLLRQIPGCNISVIHRALSTGKVNMIACPRNCLATHAVETDVELLSSTGVYYYR